MSIDLPLLRVSGSKTNSNLVIEISQLASSTSMECTNPVKQLLFCGISMSQLLQMTIDLVIPFSCSFSFLQITNVKQIHT